MKNLLEYTESQSQLLDNMRLLAASSEAVGHVLSDAAKDLLSIQSELAAASFAKALTSLVPVFAPGDPSYALWKFPTDCKIESERWAHGLMASLGVLSRVPQQLFELQGPSPTHGVQDVATVKGALASGRVSAKSFV